MSSIADILRFHAHGLQRVSRIIDGNPNYDDLMEHRLGESQWAAFDNDIEIEKKRNSAIEVFKKRALGRSYKVIIPEFSKFACDGNTLNNLREFEFFERICSPSGIKILGANYAHCQNVPIYKVSYGQNKSIEKIVEDVEEFYRGRVNITASLVRQQILYSRSFINFLFSFTAEGVARPVALIQANDHSPVRVALSMVMKGLRIPRVYLQHAEVTQSFPELDFEYSVLRNERSRQIYNNIGPASGKVFVIPRHEGKFAREKLFEARGTGMAVVIYPTARVLIERLHCMIDVLKRNPAVEKVVIKPHPAASTALDHTLAGSGVHFSDTIPDEDHIAIVGNSSIVVELLHRSVPVYQNFDFDPVRSDYYGFVKSGLTYRVSLDELSSRFWRPYPTSDDWLQAYAEWDPSAKAESFKEQSDFVNQMAQLAACSQPTPALPKRYWIKRRLMARTKSWGKRAIIRTINASPTTASYAASLILASTDRVGTFLVVNTHNASRFFQLYTNLRIKSPVWRGVKRPCSANHSALPTPAVLDLLEYTLSTVDRPDQWLKRNETVEVFGAYTLITALEAMFQNRSPTLTDIFRGFPEWPSGSALGTWIYLKKAAWGNVEVDRHELEEIATYVYECNCDARVKIALEGLLFSTIIRCGTCEQLDRFWLGTKSSKESLAINRKIDILRKLRATPRREADAERTQQMFEKHATRFERLKLRNMDFLEGRFADGWSHFRGECEFQAVASHQLSWEVAAHVRPVYDALRPQMRFMEIRTDPIQAEEFLNLVRLAIKDKRPFSFIRLSDGEAYLFPEEKFFSASDAANRERHWWGGEIPDELRSKIITEAGQALSEADIVGIPSIYRFIRDHDDLSVSLAQSLQGRGLLQVLHGVPSAIAPTAALTEDKANVALFSNTKAIVSLARFARKTIIVGSVNPENLPQTLYDATQVEVILLPTHARTKINGNYHRSSRPLPIVYSNLLERFETLAAPGDLVLVAAGIVGKIFIGRARVKGAVAIDIGSVLDDWLCAGMSTLR